MSYNQKRMSLKELKQQQALMKLRELMETFDKRYIEELFETGLESGSLDPDQMSHEYRYEFQGFVYILRREIVVKGFNIG